MKLLVGIVVLLAFAAIAVQTARKTGDDLEALCNNETISLEKLTQLDRLVQLLDDDEGEDCGDDTPSALRDLKAVVDKNKKERNQCSMVAIERYREFYLRYLDSSAKDKKGRSVKLPKSLIKFALAYGVQVASLCRANMVNRLLDDAQKAVKPEYFDAVNELVGPKGLITKAFPQTSKPDEILLPGPWLREIAKKEKMVIKVPTISLIEHILTMCKRRFEPVYKPLMLPVSKMANLGFDYRPGMLKETIRAASSNYQTNDIIGRWARIAFTCEILNELELVEDDVDREQSIGNDATQVRVMTKDEASALEDEVPTSKLLDDFKKEKHDMEPEVIFEPSLWVEIPDEILTSKSQKRAVRLVNTDRNEMDNIKRRFVLNFANQLFDNLSQFRVSSIFSHLIKTTKKAIKAAEKGKTKAPNEQLVHSLNELVDGHFNLDQAVGSQTIVIGCVITFIICIAVGAMIANG